MAVLDHHNRRCTDEEEDNKWVLCISMGPGVCIEGILCRRLNMVDEEDDEDEKVEAFESKQTWSKARARSSFAAAGEQLRGRKSTFAAMSEQWNEVAGEFGNA